MTEERANTTQGTFLVKGVLFLFGAMLALGALLYALVGPVVAAVACGLLLTAFGLTILAQRGASPTSSDPATGLPDRAAALRRLDGMLAQRHPANRQGAVVVVSIRAARNACEQRQLALMAALRLMQELRKGDQIVRVGPDALAALLEPSRGLTASSLQGILDRVATGFRAPFRVGDETIAAQVAIGGCLEGDAPAADGRAWLEAAERAACLAAEAETPLLFESGTTPVGAPIAAADDEVASLAGPRRA